METVRRGAVGLCRVKPVVVRCRRALETTSGSMRDERVFGPRMHGGAGLEHELVGKLGLAAMQVGRR